MNMLNIGYKSGKLEVIEFSHINSTYHKFYKVKCDCGVIKTIMEGNLKGGSTISCGCEHRKLSSIRGVGQKRNFKHGKSHSDIHNTWLSIKQRCYNINSTGYKDWGGRGITMYEPWINSFELFNAYILSTIGEKPKNKSIDRINNDGNYVPGNLKWSTAKEQSNNRRIRNPQPQGLDGRFISSESK